MSMQLLAPGADLYRLGAEAAPPQLIASQRLRQQTFEKLHSTRAHRL